MISHNKNPMPFGIGFFVFARERGGFSGLFSAIRRGLHEQGLPL